MAGIMGEAMTTLTRFERPVVIQIGQYDSEREVVEVNDAASILLRGFGRRTEKHRAAMDACLRVLRGEANSLAARKAFVAAAREANILRGN
ncbi:Uncharacterized protein MLTONO_p0305 (plasmid) [Mesorhizobium loti]|nr:Uncharacterized protein MLTONO_p0305 [Mesorhizobium loti]